MKKLFVMMLIVVMSIIMLAGCSNNTEDAETSDVVSEESSESSDVEETDTTDELVDASEESSEVVEETVMYSADEVMAHIDALIAQYTYNDPEHIKCMVIAANLDYIEAEELEIILTTYGYTMEDLAQMYLAEGGPVYCTILSYCNTRDWHLSAIDNLDESERYENQITFESVMLNEADKEFAKKIDDDLIKSSVLDGDESVVRGLDGYEGVTSGERLVVSYINCIFGYNYEDNPYNDYINANS